MIQRLKVQMNEAKIKSNVLWMIKTHSGILFIIKYLKVVLESVCDNNSQNILWNNVGTCKNVKIPLRVWTRDLQISQYGCVPNHVN